LEASLRKENSVLKTVETSTNHRLFTHKVFMPATLRKQPPLEAHMVILRRSLTFILLVIALSFGNSVQQNQAAVKGTGSYFLPVALREEDILDSMGPDGGSVVALAMDPNDSDILYAGTWGGGMYKSLNGGLNWQVINQGLGWLYINSLAIDPLTPTTLYAGTYMYGVYKTVDGGATWAPTGPGLSEFPIVYTIAVDPVNPNIVYIGTRNKQPGPPWGGGIYKTTDGGGTWEKFSEGLGEDWVYDIAIDPLTPSTVYAATHTQGVYKSVSGGGWWEAKNIGITDLGTRSIVIDQVSPRFVYVGSWHFGGVFKSDSGGNDWVSASTGLNHKIYSLSMDPTSRDIIYAATYRTGIMATDDAAASWHGAGLYPDLIYDVAIDPYNHDILYAGTMGDGILKSYDRGENWEDSNTGLRATSINAVVANLTTTVTSTVPLMNAPVDAVYASTYGGGIYKTINLGQTWARINNGLGEKWVYSLAMSRVDPLTLYAGTETTGFFITKDGGGTWVGSNNGLPASMAAESAFEPWLDPYLRADLFDQSFFEGVPDQTDFGDAVTSVASILSIAVDSFGPQKLYIGTRGSGIYRSTDEGVNWMATNLNTQVVYTILSDPFTPSVLYAGCDSASNSLYRSLDAGATWTLGNTGLAGLTVYALAADPITAGILYAGTSMGVYKSVDNGVNWAPFGLSGRIVSALGLSHMTPGMIFAGTSTGLYISRDNGSTWKPANKGLINQEISCLALDSAGYPQIDLIGTLGSGVYNYGINSPSTK
jgi:photosystem II stability/assembly factor-like uncharacterized protein